MDTRKQRKGVNSRLKKINPVFHLQTEEADSKELSPHLIKQARKTGHLNLSGRGLHTVPQKVWRIDDLDQVEVKRLEVKLDTDVEDEKWWEYEALTSLDLSSNTLTQISNNIVNLSSLAVLNIQDNALDDLPEEIGSLSKLARLNASHNRIKTLPSSFYKLEGLRYLNLSHNRIDELSEYIGDLVMLETLDVSHNELSVLPPGLGYLVRLLQLNLSHNKLTEFPPDLANLRVLHCLDLSNNCATTLPPLGELRKLELLFASTNDLDTFPDLTGCAALKELHLAENRLQAINTEVLEGLSHLRVLNLRDNKLSTLPDELTLLQHLTRLDLTNNNVAVLPDGLGFMPHLNLLHIDGNPLRHIRRDIVACGPTRLLRFLRDRAGGVGPKGRDIPEGEATNFPDRFVMRSGRALSLAGQNISKIPREVFVEAAEAEVTSVDLSKNQLDEVPQGLEAAGQRVTELNFSCNHLVTLSPEIAHFSNLMHLDVSRNKLSELPAELVALCRLREVCISYNRFTTLPSVLYELPSLEILLARDNQLTDIDADGLSRVRTLAVLDLANNDITRVPPQLGNMSQLRSLDLSGNSFRQPRHSVLEKGTAAVLAYLRDRIPQEKC